MRPLKNLFEISKKTTHNELELAVYRQELDELQLKFEDFLKEKKEFKIEIQRIEKITEDLNNSIFEQYRNLNKSLNKLSKKRITPDLIKEIRDNQKEFNKKIKEIGEIFEINEETYKELK